MKTLIVLIAFSLLAMPAQAASLLGTSVSGSISTFGVYEPYGGKSSGYVVYSQFSSPAIVGNGIEFTGGFADVYGVDIYTLTADFSVNSLIVHVTSPNLGDEDYGSPIATLDFGSASGSFPAIISVAHSCDDPNSFCTLLEGYVPAVTSSASSIALDFPEIGANDIYTLTFAPAAVPEPATWATMFFGLGMLGCAIRRRRKIASRVSYTD